jgi:hypothetical protein
VASVNAAVTPMSRPEADEELRRLRAEGDTISATLVGLEDHPGRRFLEGVVTAGASRDRWTAAQAAIGELWDRFGRYQDVLRRAEGTRDLTELNELLRGNVVELPAERERHELTEPSTTGPFVSLSELVTTMTSGYRAVVDVLTAAEQVWSDYVPWLDQMDERLRSATAADVAGPELGRVREELAVIRTTVFSDPLSLPGNDDRITRLTGELDAVRREIDELVRLRRERDVEVAGLRGSLGRLADAEREARDTIALARTKISAALADARDSVPVLAGRLDVVSSLADLRRLSAELAQLRAAIDTATERANQARLNARELLDRRAELRGRLEAYHVKAARLRYSEDDELAAIHQRAHDLLWRAPCDLAAATTAVLAYQRALSGKGTAR